MPVASGLEQARICRPDFEALLRGVGAKFVYVLDPGRPEGRTWDNAGRVEDVATGSAAGPAAAYLIRHQVRPDDKPLLLHQGQYGAMTALDRDRKKRPPVAGPRRREQTTGSLTEPEPTPLRGHRASVLHRRCNPDQGRPTSQRKLGYRARPGVRSRAALVGRKQTWPCEEPREVAL